MTPQAYARAADYLAKFYGVTVFERHGLRHPLVVYTPDADQINDLDSVLGTLRDTNPNDRAIYDYGYLHTLQNSGRNLYNGDTYALHRIETHPLRVFGQRGTYFDTLATCAALDNEMTHALTERALRLPLRSQLHRTLPIAQAVWRGAGRSAAIGGACLVVFNDGQTYRAILARRSSQAATDPGFYHVLPAFICQPTRGDWQGEWCFSQHVYREYLEELFGVAEGTDTHDHPALHDLQTMLTAGSASLYLTGVSMNLLTLRPEISALLLIRDAGWWARLNAPDSLTPLDTHAEALDGRIATVPIASDAALLAELPDALHTLMPPQGYAALWLGMEMARHKLGITETG